MNSPASTFHEDHLRRKAQSLQLAFTRAVKLCNGVELKAVGFKGPNQFGKHADVMPRMLQGAPWLGCLPLDPR